MRARHGARAAGALVVLSVVVGCAGSGSPEASPSGSSSPRSSASATASGKPATQPAIAPLIGLPAAASAVGRPAVAVDIGATPGTPAPSGLGAADLVYAEYAEGGLVRLVALFQSRDAPRVGPVIPTRPADAKLLAVFRGCLAYGGGTTGFVQEVTKAGLCQLTPFGTPSLFALDPNLPAAFNRFTSTPALFAAARGRSAPPTPFSFASAGQPLASTGVTSVTRMTVTMPGRATQTWTYDAKSRIWRSAAPGGAWAVSVVVLVMPYKGIAVRRPTAILQSATVFGSGAATLVSGPHAARGSWYRPGYKSLTNLVDGANQVMHPLPGATWVLLAPTGSTVTLQ